MLGLAERSLIVSLVQWDLACIWCGLSWQLHRYLDRVRSDGVLLAAASVFWWLDLDSALVLDACLLWYLSVLPIACLLVAVGMCECSSAASLILLPFSNVISPITPYQPAVPVSLVSFIHPFVHVPAWKDVPAEAGDLRRMIKIYETPKVVDTTALIISLLRGVLWQIRHQLVQVKRAKLFPFLNYYWVWVLGRWCHQGNQIMRQSWILWVLRLLRWFQFHVGRTLILEELQIHWWRTLFFESLGCWPCVLEARSELCDWLFRLWLFNNCLGLLLLPESDFFLVCWSRQEEFNRLFLVIFCSCILKSRWLLLNRDLLARCLGWCLNFACCWVTVQLLSW